jgi:hypothetical protein
MESDHAGPVKRRKNEQIEQDGGDLIDRISDKAKPSNPLGSIIGRKRKIKKARRSGG